VHLPEFSDHVLVIVDMGADAAASRRQILAAGHVNKGGGETPTWPQGRRYALHHALVAGNLFYSAWRDGGSPSSMSAIRQSRSSSVIATGIRRSAAAPIRRCRCRTAICLWSPTKRTSPIASKGLRYIWTFDVREPSNPVSISTMPIPDEADYCKKGGNFGPHNLWENRPGAFVSSRFIFATLHNAGVRVYDIKNPFAPRETGYFVPPPPAKMYDPRPNRPQVIQSCDCFVDAQGVMYVTDSNAGLYILQFEGG
jgi:hypothetical protein